MALASCLAAAEFHKECTNSLWPAAIAFMVVDFKYNSEQGIKICEVQHGSTSKFKLGRYARDGECETTRLFVETFAQWKPSCWIKDDGIADKTLLTVLKGSPKWSITKDYKKLLTNKYFKKIISKPVLDPEDINNYHAICYGWKKAITPLLNQKQLYPGILIIDEPTFPYWTDKLKMGLMFKRDPILEQIKPVWSCYDKYLANDVYQKILEDIPGDYVIIKPRATFLSKGVIAIHKNELQKLLKLIIDNPSNLKKHPDPNWRYWSSDRSSSFVVEQFIESDALPAENGKFYDVTYRTTFLLFYEHKQITLQLFDTYLKYPKKSLDEKGSFTEQHCSHPEEMQKGFIPPEIIVEIEDQLSEPLLLLFEKMLSSKN